MRKLLLLFAFAFLAWPVFGQTPSRVDGVLQDALGRALPGATVYVCTQPCVLTSVPPSPLATIFSDSASTPVPLAGQVSTDGNGNFFFYTLGSLFTEVFVFRGRIVKILPDQTPKGGGAGFNCGSPTAPGILYFNGTACIVDPNALTDGNGNVVVASLTANGAVTATSFVTTGAGGVFAGTEQTAPTTPLAGQFSLYVDSGSNKLTCILNAGSCNPTGSGGATLSTNGVNNSSQVALNFVTSPAFNGLTLTPSNPGGAGNEQFTFSGTLGNAGLTNPSITVSGVTCTLGSSCTPGTQSAPYVPISDNATTAVGFAFNGNATNLFAFVPKGNFTTTQFEYNVQTADNTAALYDIGVYNSTGTLLGHTGATAGTTIAPSTGNKNIAWLSSFSLTGGQLYFFAMTGNAGTFKLGAAGTVVSLYCGVNPSSGNTTSGGVLNSSMTPPSAAVTAVCNFPGGIAW